MLKIKSHSQIQRARRKICYFSAAALTMLTFVFAPSVGAFDTTRINFKISPITGEIYFLEAMRGDPHLARETIRNEFYARRGHNPQDELLLSEYKKVIEDTDIAVCRFETKQQTRGIEHVMEQLALSCPDMPSFLNAVQSFVSVNDYAVIRRTLLHFEPLYRQIFWQPLVPKLRLQIKRIEAASNRIQLSKRFQQVSAVYGSNWPTGCNLTITFIPLPDEHKKHQKSTGHCDGTMAVLEIIQGEDPTFRTGIAFHEFCHSLWEQRSKESQRALEQSFAENNGGPAYALLNEALACVFGNGWIDTLLQGSHAPKGWYSDPYVESYAHHLYPLAMSYLNSHRQLDQAFARQAVKTFFAQFPDANQVTKLALFNTVIFVDPQSELCLNIKRLLFESTARSIETGWPLNSPESKTSFFKNASSTAIFAITPDELPHLQNYSLTNEDIDQVGQMSRGKLPFLWCKQIKGRWIVACIGNTADEQEKVFREFIAGPKIPVAN